MSKRKREDATFVDKAVQTQEPPKKKQKVDHATTGVKRVDLTDVEYMFSLDKMDYDKNKIKEFHGWIDFSANGEFFGGYKGRFDRNSVIRVDNDNIRTNDDECVFLIESIIDKKHLPKDKDILLTYEYGIIGSTWDKKKRKYVGGLSFEKHFNFDVYDTVKNKLPEELKKGEYRAEFDHHYMGTTFFKDVVSVDVYFYITKQRYDKEKEKYAKYM